MCMEAIGWTGEVVHALNESSGTHSTKAACDADNVRESWGRFEGISRSRDGF
jgi:hypothetical protein